jgi:hypothetical protein
MAQSKKKSLLFKTNFFKNIYYVVLNYLLHNLLFIKDFF